MLVWV